MGPLTAFAVRPVGVRFETQEAQEQVMLFLRQHMIVNVPWAVLAIVLLMVPSVLFPFALGLFKLPFVLPMGYVIIGTLFWYIAIFGFVLGNFLGWFFNIYIVTNQRIIDIDFIHLLYKQFSEAQVSRIQDISYRTKGLLPTVFDFGDVAIQTAGELPNFHFDRVPHPDKVVDTVGDLAKKYKKNL